MPSACGRGPSSAHRRGNPRGQTGCRRTPLGDLAPLRRRRGLLGNRIGGFRPRYAPARAECRVTLRDSRCRHRPARSSRHWRTQLRGHRCRSSTAGTTMHHLGSGRASSLSCGRASAFVLRQRHNALQHASFRADCGQLCSAMPKYRSVIENVRWPTQRFNTDGFSLSSALRVM